jgi:hypothetical protein
MRTIASKYCITGSHTKVDVAALAEGTTPASHIIEHTISKKAQRIAHSATEPS